MKFGKVSSVILAAILSVVMIGVGCNVAEWITVAENDLPVIVQIVTNILQIADVAAIPQAKAAGARRRQTYFWRRRSSRNTRRAPTGPLSRT